MTTTTARLVSAVICSIFALGHAGDCPEEKRLAEGKMCTDSTEKGKADCEGSSTAAYGYILECGWVGDQCLTTDVCDDVAASGGEKVSCSSKAVITKKRKGLWVGESNDIKGFAIPDCNADFSISGWAKCDPSCGEMLLGGLGSPGRFYVSNGYFGLGDSRGEWHVKIPTNEWFLFVITVKPAQKRAGLFLIDAKTKTWQGAEKASRYDNLNACSVNEAALGGLNQGGTQPSRSWNGLIDEWAAWSKALSEDERNAVFNDGKMADLKTLGAIHWWRMGEKVEADKKITDEIGTAHLWAGEIDGFEQTPGWGC